MAEKKNLTINKIYKQTGPWLVVPLIALIILAMAVQPVIRSHSKISDADTLDGFDSTYFATRYELNTLPDGGETVVVDSTDEDWNETTLGYIALNNQTYQRVRIGGDTPPSKDLVVDSGDASTEAFILIQLSLNRFLKLGNDGNDDSIIGWDDADDLVFMTYPTGNTEVGGDEQMRITSSGELQQTNGGVTWSMYVNATGVLVWEMS